MKSAHISALVVVLFIGLYSCDRSKAQVKSTVLEPIIFHGLWNLSEADTLVALPSQLREISGMSPYQRDLIACIQDEAGKIYFLNKESYALEQTHFFGSAADYEAIACRDSTCDVIMSNERLVHVPIMDGASSTKNQLKISGKCETESISYYRDGWLTICKSGQSGEVFFIEADGQTTKNLFRLSTKDLAEFIAQKKPHLLKEINTRKSWINPSDIFYHESTHSLFVVCGISKLLLAIDMANGKVTDAIFLDPAIFRQAEGITVDQEGRLLISSEGVGTAGIMARFTKR